MRLNSAVVMSRLISPNRGLRNRGIRDRCLLLFAALAAIACSPLQSLAQNQFINPGFESNTFNGWTLKYGSYSGGPISWGSTRPPGHPVPQIVTNATFGNVNIPTAMCGTYMARINDLGGSFHATCIEQTIALDKSHIDACGTAAVEVCWIGVVNDPVDGNRHTSTEQPAFSFELLNDGAVVDSSFVESGTASSSGSGWSSAGPYNPSYPSLGTIWYRQYCTLLIVLDAQVGDLLTVRVFVRDCSLGAHGAMAFLDCVNIISGYPDTGSFSSACGDGDFDLSFGASKLTREIWGVPPVSFCVPQRLLAAGDFNGDGACDLADYRPDDGSFICGGHGVRKLLSTGSSLAPSTMTVPVPTNWNRFHAGDFDGDGFSDLIGFRSPGNFLRILWGGSTQITAPAGLTTATGGDFWIGDFDGNGRDDLLRFNGNQLEVARADTACALSRGGPFLAFAPWGTAPSGLAAANVYVGDFNGDSRSDLMGAYASGLYVWLSTGSRFAPVQQWVPNIGPGEYLIGDFDCDNVSDIARRNTSNGRLEMLLRIGFTASFGAPSSSPFMVGWVDLSYSAVPSGPFKVGDFDGNGRDDVLRVNIPANVIEVFRSCESCPCLYARAGTPRCDPNDATKYFLPLTITNRIGLPISDVSLAPLTGFSVSPSPVSVMGCGPLLHRKSRTVEVQVMGATPNTFELLRVNALAVTPGGDIRTCSTETCFIPPTCDCMQVYSEGEWTSCDESGSGVPSLNFSVQNASGQPSCGVRLTSLTSGVSVTPDTYCFPPLATGSSINLTGRFQVVGAPGALTRIRVELLSCNVAGCDPCACQEICDEEFSFEMPTCPTILGECCFMPGGIQLLTQARCQAGGGTWSPPGTSMHCPQTVGSGGARTTIVAIGNGTFITFNEEQRMFLSAVPLDGSGGADISFNAVTDVSLPLERLTGDDAETFPGLSLGAVGTLDGIAGQRLGTLDLSVGPDESFLVLADFATLKPEFITIIVSGGEPHKPIIIAGGQASLTLLDWPSNVVAITSGAGKAAAGHGYSLEFETLVSVQIDDGPLLYADKLEILADTGSRQVEYLTSVELRARNLPLVAMGIISIESTPCLGDLNGDCVIDQDDLDLMIAGLGNNPELDLNGDGVVDQSDLSILLANLNTSCACREPCPPLFADGFETYPLGDICGVGGWEPWIGSVDTCGSATTEQAYTGSRSLKLVGNVGGSTGLGDDMVQRFSGAVSGAWTFRTMTFVPTSATGIGYLNLLSTYDDPPGSPLSDYRWSVQVHFNADANQVIADFNAGSTALVKGRWVEFRVEINLDNDLADYFYDGVPFVQNRSWTCGVGAPFCGTHSRIQALDLYAGEPATNGTSGMYFDDLSLQEVCRPAPPPCAADFNGDGNVNSQDFFDFVAAFFSDAPTADFNHDGTINSQDFFDFLVAFFAGCP